MARGDVEQIESSGETLGSLRRELEGKIKDLEDKLDPKIEKRVPIWVLGLVVTVLLTAAGWTFLALNGQVTSLSAKVGQLDKDIAVTNQKMDDSRKH